MSGGTKYEADRAFADSYRAPVLEILRRDCLFALAEVLEADEHRDTKQATDFIVQAAHETIAVRVRSDGRDFRDWTVRSRRDSGATTELAKISAGWARWYLYCWTKGAGGPIVEYILIDLDKVRAVGLLTMPWREMSNGDGTYFIAIKVDVLREVGAIMKDAVTSACPSPRPPALCQATRRAEGSGHYAPPPRPPAQPSQKSLFDWEAP